MENSNAAGSRIGLDAAFNPIAIGMAIKDRCRTEIETWNEIALNQTLKTEVNVNGLSPVGDTFRAKLACGPLVLGALSDYMAGCAASQTAWVCS